MYCVKRFIFTRSNARAPARIIEARGWDLPRTRAPYRMKSTPTHNRNALIAMIAQCERYSKICRESSTAAATSSTSRSCRPDARRRGRHSSVRTSRVPALNAAATPSAVTGISCMTDDSIIDGSNRAAAAAAAAWDMLYADDYCPDRLATEQRRL
uniref:Uncharacterized protein n=1 Tax=Setaria viridis TaxID=4556 RepID=A0A4V6D0I4_SETVI|nr:hypothetical protein SEVIR_9G061250v2 [Setaria viridis]